MGGEGLPPEGRRFYQGSTHSRRKQNVICFGVQEQGENKDVLHYRSHVNPCLKAFAKVELGGNVLELCPITKRKRAETDEEQTPSELAKIMIEQDKLTSSVLKERGQKSTSRKRLHEAVEERQLLERKNDDLQKELEVEKKRVKDMQKILKDIGQRLGPILEEIQASVANFVSLLLGSPSQGPQMEALPPLDPAAQQLCWYGLTCLAQYLCWVLLSSVIRPQLLSAIFHFAAFGCQPRPDASKDISGTGGGNGCPSLCPNPAILAGLHINWIMENCQTLLDALRNKTQELKEQSNPSH